jgi:hypothetical protein
MGGYLGEGAVGRQSVGRWRYLHIGLIPSIRTVDQSACDIPISQAQLDSEPSGRLRRSGASTARSLLSHVQTVVQLPNPSYT